MHTGPRSHPRLSRQTRSRRAGASHGSDSRRWRARNIKRLPAPRQSRSGALHRLGKLSVLLLLLWGPPSAWSSEPTASGDPGATGEARLVAIPQPNLEHMDEATQRALSSARTNLEMRVTEDESTDEQLALLYGDTGLLYQAHQVFAAADACYQNALRLAPGEFRWRYYLAYLYQYTGRLSEAADAYRHMEAKPSSIWKPLSSGHPIPAATSLA